MNFNLFDDTMIRSIYSIVNMVMHTNSMTLSILIKLSDFSGRVSKEKEMIDTTIKN